MRSLIIAAGLLLLVQAVQLASIQLGTLTPLRTIDSSWLRRVLRENTAGDVGEAEAEADPAGEYSGGAPSGQTEADNQVVDLSVDGAGDERNATLVESTDVLNSTELLPQPRNSDDLAVPSVDQTSQVNQTGVASEEEFSAANPPGSTNGSAAEVATLAPVNKELSTDTENAVLPAADAPPATDAPPVNDVPPASDALPPSDALPATDAPPSNDVPPAGDAPPATDAPPSNDVPPAGDAPPATDAPSANDVPPAGDAPQATDAPPSNDVPPATDAPPSNDVPPVGDVPPPTDAPPATDAPPVNDAPPPTDALPPPAAGGPTPSMTPTEQSPNEDAATDRPNSPTPPVAMVTADEDLSGRDGGSGDNSERGSTATENQRNARQQAWGAVLATAVAVAFVGLVAYIVIKKKYPKGFSHRKLVEEFPADPVLRLDNSEPLDLNFDRSGYYNPGLQGDDIQMGNIPKRR